MQLWQFSTTLSEVQMKWVFLIAEFERAVKIRKIAVYHFLNLWIPGEGVEPTLRDPPKGFSQITFDWHKLWRQNFGYFKLTPNLIGRYDKITNLALNFGRERLKMEGNWSNRTAFFNFVANFWDKRGNLVFRKVWRGCSNYLGINWRNSSYKPREIGFFLISALYFHPSLPEIGHSLPVNKHFFGQI